MACQRWPKDKVLLDGEGRQEEIDGKQLDIVDVVVRASACTKLFQ